jgi:hypothetical protein
MSYKLNQNLNFRDQGFHLTYGCMSCGDVQRRTANIKNFDSNCGRCQTPCQINFIKTSFTMLYGAYICNLSKCRLKWTEKLPFKCIIVKTPICQPCHRFTKIGMIIYKRTKITFKNSWLFKCEKCSKCKSVGSYSPSFPPICDYCQVAMSCQKKLKSIFTSKLNFRQNKSPMKIEKMEYKSKIDQK